MYTKIIEYLEKYGINIKGNFFLSIIQVMTGTGFSYIIFFLSTLFLTRLYTPSDFGIFGIYQAIVTIGALLVTGRYELAIPVPEKDEAGWALVKLSILLSIISSILFLLVVTILKPKLFQTIEYFEILIPLGLIIYSSWQSTELWLNRKGFFAWGAISRVIGALILGFTQIILFYLGCGASGLILGFVIGFLASALINGIKSFNIKPNIIYSMKNAAIEYSNFPKYLLISQVFNAGLTHLPTIFIGNFFGKKITGFYSLGTKAMSAVELIATATYNVFFPKAAKDYSINNNCTKIYNKIFIILSIISFLIFPLLFIIIPDIFAIIYGEQWREAGNMMRFLIPMYAIRFIVSPVTSLYSIAGKQIVFLFKTILTFILVIVSLYIGVQVANIKILLALYCISMIIGYIIDGLVTFKLSKGYYSH